MKRFTRILCVVSPGDSSRHALERAVTLAQNNQAHLTLIDVVEVVTAGIGMPEGGPISADLQEVLVDARTRSLQALAGTVASKVDVTTRVSVGVPFLEVVREVLRGGHDLVLKMAEAHDWLEHLFGSDDMHILRKCPCPVWLIGPRLSGPFRRILAAVDLDEDYPPAEQEVRRALNRQILEMASSLALSDFAELHIGHAWDAPAESAMRGAFIHARREEIDDYVATVGRHHEAGMQRVMREVDQMLGPEGKEFLRPVAHSIKGSARREIPALARQIEADLVVMGTVGRTGIPGFLMGNTAETIINHIDCSVLTVKPPGFRSPITLGD